MSERMYVMWSEGKLLFGEIEAALGPAYSNLISASMWFFDGKSRKEFDVRNSSLTKNPRGIPVHGIKNKLGALDFSLEAFSEFGLRPTCYVKVRVENNTDEKSAEILGAMIRTGKECELIEGAPDVYGPYNPKLSNWVSISPTWKKEIGYLTDGERRICTQGNIDFEFSSDTGELIAELSLEPGEVREGFFAFNIGAVESLDYEAKKEKAISCWERELARIDAARIPESVLGDGEKMATIMNLTVQLLQCFCRPKGKNFVFARQGGLQRQVWTFESLSVLESLSRLGDFADYIEPIIELYFNEFVTETGEVRIFGIQWGMVTANVIDSFSSYAIKKGDAAYFEKYFNAALKSFRWIRETRLSVKDAPNIVGGLFPPLQSTDCAFVCQSWLFTDVFNLRAIRAFADACEFFGKTDIAKEARAEFEEYLGLMKRTWERIKTYDGDKLILPYSPGLPDEIVEKSFSFSPGIAYFVEMLDLDEDDVFKIINTYTEKGMIRGGLYDRMPNKANPNNCTRYNLDENGKCIVWYVCCAEYYWFLYFLRHGYREKCEEILSSLYRFAMTEEYYMIERFNQRDPYFTPWSPNASANGRIVNILLDLK